MTQKQVLKLIENDPWMIEMLKNVEKLNLPDWWIGAGFVRSKVWDYQHGYKTRTPIPDIDVIYFDKSDFSEIESEKESTLKEEDYQRILTKKIPNINWSVTNQARMHKFHRRKPYKNSEEALSEWSETATCVGIKINKDKLLLVAPYGVSDLVNLKLRKIPNYDLKYPHDPNLIYNRMKKKKWLTKWPKLTIID